MTRTADEVLAVALKEGADELVVGIPVVMDGNINDFRTDSKHVSQTLVDNARYLLHCWPHACNVWISDADQTPTQIGFRILST